MGECGVRDRGDGEEEFGETLARRPADVRDGRPVERGARRIWSGSSGARENKFSGVGMVAAAGREKNCSLGRSFFVSPEESKERSGK